MVFVKEDDIDKAINPSDRKRNQRRKAAIELQRKKESLCR